jgi:hypothetical protein
MCRTTSRDASESAFHSTDRGAGTDETVARRRDRQRRPACGARWGHRGATSPAESGRSRKHRQGRESACTHGSVSVRLGRSGFATSFESARGGSTPPGATPTIRANAAATRLGSQEAPIAALHRSHGSGQSGHAMPCRPGPCGRHERRCARCRPPSRRPPLEPFTSCSCGRARIAAAGAGPRSPPPRGPGRSAPSRSCAHPLPTRRAR